MSPSSAIPLPEGRVVFGGDVSASNSQSEYHDSGSARVFSGQDGSTLYTFDGDNRSDGFGFSVSGAGDVNNDGFADVIVGSEGRFDFGSARVLSGQDGGTLYTFVGDNPNIGFGFSVSRAGDVNNDGFPDVIVGARLDDTNGSNSGSARVLSGQNGSTLFTFNGDGPDDLFGLSVSGAGDVNNDGHADLIVGTSGDESVFSNSGSARVLSGLDGGILYTFDADRPDDRFGASVSGAGDVNNDGYADLIIGASRDDNNGSDSGSARVLSGQDGTALYTFNGENPDDLFGWSVSGAGDVNNDGYADLIVGVPFDTSSNSAGSVRILSGLDGSTLYRFEGDSPFDFFGWSVSGAGDVNGDGVDDFIVGTGLFNGNYARVFASQISAFVLGDVNGDGLVDFSDIEPFIAVLISGNFQDEADIDRNGLVNFEDIPSFVAILIEQ